MPEMPLGSLVELLAMLPVVQRLDQRTVNAASQGSVSFLVQEDLMEEAAHWELAGGEVVALTRAGPGDNRKNEDAAAIVATGQDGALLAVSDGFGGAPAGERASWIAATEVAGAASESRVDDRPLRTVILDSFESANRKILELGIGAAATLAAIGIEDGIARPFHSGDSAILLVGGRGKIKWQTVSHSPAGYAVASGWVAESEARRHDEAQVVSNYLGFSEMRIEVGPELRLAPRDIILLASDGLTDNLALEEVASALVREPTLTLAIADIARRARHNMDSARGKPDDLTLVAYRRRPSTRNK